LQFPTWCSILELARTAFAACGGEEFPPRKFGKAAARTEQSRSEPHRSKPQKNPEKNIGSNHILILGEENFLTQESIRFRPLKQQECWFLFGLDDGHQLCYDCNRMIEPQ